MVGKAMNCALAPTPARPGRAAFDPKPPSQKPVAGERVGNPVQGRYKEEMMKKLVTTTIAATLIVLAPALTTAQEAPQFMQETWPEAAVDGAWQEFQAVMDPDGALDAKTKELIGLAVAAQVPCDYCVYYHTKAAEAHGATDAQIKEALASAALVRKWSTVLNGSQYDPEEWAQQVDAMFSGQ
jgi:AhpD family alkylhydroperoxidase